MKALVLDSKTKHLLVFLNRMGVDMWRNSLYHGRGRMRAVRSTRNAHAYVQRQRIRALADASPQGVIALGAMRVDAQGAKTFVRGSSVSHGRACARAVRVTRIANACLHRQRCRALAGWSPERFIVLGCDARRRQKVE